MLTFFFHNKVKGVEPPLAYQKYKVNHYISFNCPQVKINQTKNQKYSSEHTLFRGSLCGVAKGVVFISSDKNIITIYYPNDGKDFLLLIECSHTYWQ